VADAGVDAAFFVPYWWLAGFAGGSKSGFRHKARKRYFQFMFWMDCVTLNSDRVGWRCLFSIIVMCGLILYQA